MSMPPTRSSKTLIKKNKLAKDKFFLFSLIWCLLLILATFLLSKFFLLSLALLPIAIYEFIRTEGKTHTKPLSDQTDPYIFLSIIILLICSLLLIKYTWGSITKFLAILLLAGSLIQASLFWSDIKMLIGSQEGKTLLDQQSRKIKNNLFYRLKRELDY